MPTAEFSSRFETRFQHLFHTIQGFATRISRTIQIACELFIILMIHTPYYNYNLVSR